MVLLLGDRPLNPRAGLQEWIELSLWAKPVAPLAVQADAPHVIHRPLQTIDGLSASIAFTNVFR